MHDGGVRAHRRSHDGLADDSHSTTTDIMHLQYIRDDTGLPLPSHLLYRIVSVKSGVEHGQVGRARRGKRLAFEFSHGVFAPA